MKKSILTLLALLPFFVFAQKQDTVIFKGASKMISTNNKDAQDNFRFAGSSLISLGYDIGQKDTDFFQFTTAPVKIEGINYIRQLIFQVSTKDNGIVITPKTKRLNNVIVITGISTENMLEPFVFGKDKISKDIGEKMMKIAQKLGGKITYSE
ncbi:hypothetical protein ACJVDH_00145 [Pedobacter sp. AW1-32]|uniref:hypothetical protein n=1 Tax=Pedobacter sp. AW1-32 TaxID=3383026 RepID=UPI003FEE209C